MDKVQFERECGELRGEVAKAPLPLEAATLVGRFSPMPLGPLGEDGGDDEFPLLRSIIGSLRV